MSSGSTANGTAQPSSDAPAAAPLFFARILVALDASDHANRALDEAIRILDSEGGTITGVHAYAAALHDKRFRQMEGGLPERYQQEDEMEHQREVHDDLITRGLTIISDSYHDVAAQTCEGAKVNFKRLSPEGKNYREVLNVAASGEFDVIAMGALGLGAVPDSVIGTVCERVARRSPIDTLVIKDPNRAIGDGPIVVAMDGSTLAYGALRTAIALGNRVGAPVHVVGAYDPYYHYVAFNKISKVLSEEAGKVFRFKEQEQLHEELIDEGIAKIYQSHLNVARTVAADEGAEVDIELLAGKPYRAIAQYVEKVGASLLVMGKTGIHADDDLDIGGNAENLLRMVKCHVWLGQIHHTPPIDLVAEETIQWSEEAEESLARAPSFVQGMARKAVIRHAHALGHTFITRSIVQEVAGQMMGGMKAGDGPIAGKQSFDALVWSDEARTLLDDLDNPSLIENIRLRAEKAARGENADHVTVEHLRPFMDVPSTAAESDELPWAAAALARLARVPEPMRPPTKQRIEDAARATGATQVTLEIVEQGLIAARAAMQGAMATKHPVETPKANALAWTADASARMEKIPAGFIRDMTRERVETYARKNGATEVTADLINDKYADWGMGSAQQSASMPWDATAETRISRIPDFVRGMVILEVERAAQKAGLETVTETLVDQAMAAWKSSGVFHSQ